MHASGGSVMSPSGCMQSGMRMESSVGKGAKSLKFQLLEDVKVPMGVPVHVQMVTHLSAEPVTRSWCSSRNLMEETGSL